MSILIPCHNAEQWIGEAIESALQQVYNHKEVVVVDDGSTDGSWSVIRSFGIHIRSERIDHVGGNAARNRLLDMSIGEWLQYLDADDYLLPDKIASQIEVLRCSDDTDVLFGPVTLQHHEEEHIRQEVLPISAPHDPWRLLALWELPQTGSPLWRKQALLDVGGWKQNQLCCQEHELYLRLLSAGKAFTYTEHGGAVYRQWSDSTVCKRNIPETYRQRIAITQRAETRLEEYGGMTPERRAAFNQTYLACSRIIWTFDRDWAKSIMDSVQRSNKNLFVPAADQVSNAYRMIYRVLGFDAAEAIAAWRRSAGI